MKSTHRVTVKVITIAIKRNLIAIVMDQMAGIHKFIPLINTLVNAWYACGLIVVLLLCIIRKWAHKLSVHCVTWGVTWSVLRSKHYLINRAGYRTVSTSIYFTLCSCYVVYYFNVSGKIHWQQNLTARSVTSFAALKRYLHAWLYS